MNANQSLFSALRSTIAFKVFGLTAGILLLFSIITYLVIFTLLPHTYKDYKQQQLENEVDHFITSIEGLPDKDVEQAFNKLREQTRAFITISDGADQILAPHIESGYAIAISEAGGALGGTLTPAEYSDGANTNTQTSAREAPMVSRSLTYKGQQAKLQATTALQPIDEASKVLGMLAPYVALFILIASIGGSFLYTFLITRPIRKITASASRMAELELDTRIPVHSSDEIGRLAESLNIMAANLKGSISDLETANEQLQMEMKREREVETRRRELFAAVSHELKSPLTILKGQLEGMLYKIGIYKDRDAYLHKTLEVAEEMETLIGDILHVAKSDRLSLPSDDELISVQDLVLELLAKYEELGMQRTVYLHSSLPASMEIRSDRKLLETALSNVIHNAIVYTNPGEQVFIRPISGAYGQGFEVVNTGAKIDPSKIGRIFEPFYRLEQSRNRNTGGSGLGLYITKNMLQQLDIGVEARNTDEGVAFSFYFPEAAITFKSHPVSIPSPDTQAKLVLVRQTTT